MEVIFPGNEEVKKKPSGLHHPYELEQCTKSLLFYLLKIWHVREANWEMGLSFSWEIRKACVIGEKEKQTGIIFSLVKTN